MAIKVNTEDPINMGVVVTDPNQTESSQNTSTTENQGGTSGIPVENEPDPYSDMSVGDFGQVPSSATAEEQAMIRYNAQASAPNGEVGALSSDVLFPGATPVRQIGSVSNKYGTGAIIGGGAGPFPVGAMLARKKALADAASAKAKAQAEQKFASETPQFKIAKQFQGSLAKNYQKDLGKYIQQAQKDYGQDWKSALNNSDTTLGREFQMFNSGYNSLVERGDRIASVVESMEAKEAKGQVFTDRAYDLRDSYYSLSQDLTDEDGNADPYKLAAMEKITKDLIAYDSMETVMKNYDIDSLAGRLVESGGYKDLGDLMENYESKSKTYTDDIGVVADQLLKEGGLLRSQYRAGIITKEDITAWMDAQLGSEKMYKKRATTASSSGKISDKDIYEPSESATEVVFDTFSPSEGEEKQFNLNLKEGTQFPSGGKVLNATGLEVINGPGGSSVPLTGTQKVQLVKVGVDNNSIDMGGNGISIPMVIGLIEEEVTKQRPMAHEKGGYIKPDGSRTLNPSEAIVEDYKEKQVIEAPIKWSKNLESLIMSNYSNLKLTKSAAEKLIETTRGSKQQTEEKPSAY